MASSMTHAGELMRELFRSLCPRDHWEGIEEANPDRPVLIAGHRGSPLFEPENTIPSFARALKDGANAIELDLCITRDERIVSWHDWTPDGAVARVRWLEIEPQNSFRPTRPEERFQGPVSDFDLDLFREKYGYARKKGNEVVDVLIPTLDEVMAWAVEQEGIEAIFLDCKIPNEQSHMGPAFIRELDRIIGPWTDRFEFILEILDTEMIPHALTSKTVHHISYDKVVPPGLVLDVSEHSSAKDSIHHNLGASLVLRPRLTTFAPWTTYRRIMKNEMSHAREAEESSTPLIFAATINRPEEFECLRRMGVTAFQTDLPHVMSGLVG